MGRKGPVDRVVYPAVREMQMCTRTTVTPAPNFWSLDHDQKTWLAQGKGFSLHKVERTYQKTPGSASATDFYNTDQGAKMSLTHKTQCSPFRYVGMRTQSAGRDSPVCGSFGGLPERVGPGSYDTHLRPEMPRSSPGSSAFASGVVRSVPDPMNRGRTAEPGYSTLATDHAKWKRHANRQAKGYTFSETQRWQRPAGPGSNRPSERGTPGPGAYGRLHDWPQAGFRGSARGYNHNQSVG